MSDVPATVDTAAESLQTGYEYLRSNYEILALTAIIAFMLWVRLRAIGNFIDGNKVYFAGNDAYYHYREIGYVVRHWPFTMPFDPWTYFPYGTAEGQFGTLFDQLIATAALIIGLGSPSDKLIAEVVIVAPTVFGSLVAIPTFLIARRLAGRRAGLIAAVILALLPGIFLRRSLVGFADHNIAEVLFQSMAVFAFMVAISVAERDQPVYELVLDRDWSALRGSVSAALGAGVAVFLYIWVWPPAVVLVGILGIFFIVAIPLHVHRGRSPEPLAVVGAISMATVCLLVLPTLDTLEFATTSISLLQFSLAFAVGLGCVFMAWLARLWDRRNYQRTLYPVTIGLSAVFGLSVITFVLPTFYNTLVSNFLRTFAFGQTDTTLTIAEAQSIPLESIGDYVYRQYGLAFPTGLAGIVGLSIVATRSRNYDPEVLLVVIWSIAITLMAFTQVRFNYYLAVVVAVTTAWLVNRFLRIIKLSADPREIEVYQVLSLIVVFIVVVAPLVPPFAIADVTTVGKSNGPGEVVSWTEELDWMEENTPIEGGYGGASNEMEYYGTYKRTDDFAYPDGAYGVMSWWDYGHWITVEGERIPDANPFQQGPRPASAFLLTDNETRANLILEALPSTTNAHSLSNGELRDSIASQSPQQAHEDTRYVMIDDQMAAGKFSAIATWTGPGFREGYLSQQQFRLLSGGQANVVGLNQRYHQTMLARLYFQDARGLSHYRLVHETSSMSSIVNVAQQQTGGSYQTVVLNRRLSQPLLTTVQQRNDLAFFDVRQASSVKTYERVPGATLSGTVPNTSEPTSLNVGLRLKTNTGRNVTYSHTTQTDANGDFEITVPYSTDNSLGVDDGATNESVIATGNYTVVAGSIFQRTATGQVDVPERAIYDGSTIEVDLQPVERNETSTNGNTSENASSIAELDFTKTSFPNPQTADLTGASIQSVPLAASRS